MAKRRIFQIAKELNISHTDILSFLKLKNIEVGSHMAPIDEDVYKIILAEFHKDKESVERYRKEQVRREIHDTRILDRQKQNKKLNILTIDEQRKLETKEREKVQEEEKRKENLKPAYFIQLAVSGLKKPLNEKPFSNLERVSIKKEGRLYRYLQGDYNSKSECQKDLLFAKKNGFPDAFIVAFKNNEKISLTEAERLSQ